MDDGQRQRILALASDFPRLWNDPATPHRERKRLARLLIDDVTLTKATRSLGVRLRGGAIRELTWTPDPPIYERFRTKDEIVAEIDRLLNDHTEGEVADILNRRGCRTAHGLAFTQNLVKATRHHRGLKSRYERLRDRGLLTAREAGERLAVSEDTVHAWHKAGLLRADTYGDKVAACSRSPTLRQRNNRAGCCRNDSPPSIGTMRCSMKHSSASRRSSRTS